MIAVAAAAVGLCFILAGLAIYSVRRANTQSDRAWDEAARKHDARLEHTNLKGEHDKALLVIDGLKRENEGLRNALQVAQDEFHALATHTVTKVDSPEAASLMRFALERLERLRTQVPASTASTSTEGGDSVRTVHVAASGSAAEVGSADK